MTGPSTFRVVRAFAKINLDLRVGALQADGYHPLERSSSRSPCTTR